MIKTYSTKPEVVEAIQFDGSTETFCAIREWSGVKLYYDYQSSPGVFLKKTKDKHLPVYKNDIVFKGKDGFKVLSQEDFNLIYSEELDRSQNVQNKLDR